MANRSDGGLGMVGRSGCGSTRSHSTSSGQAPSAGSGQVLRGRRDVVRLGPPKTAGRLTMNGKGMGHGGREAGVSAAWDVFSRSGECVQSVGPMCSVLGPMCSVFGRMCSVSAGHVFTLAGMCASFRRGGLGSGGTATGWPEWGIGCGRKAGFLGGPRSARRKWRPTGLGWGRGAGQAVAQSWERTSACSRTVLVACSCLSGG